MTNSPCPDASFTEQPFGLQPAFWKPPILTYGESMKNGGMYDPDNHLPDNGSTVGVDCLGFRMPFFIDSPYDPFDIGHPDFSVPSLPEPKVDPAELDR